MHNNFVKSDMDAVRKLIKIILLMLKEFLQKKILKN